MSKMHAPDNPHGEVKHDGTTKPEKTCPICGDTTKDLPAHIRRGCEPA